MKIDVYFTPLGLNAADLTGRGVVVIDVLRATSSIVTALSAGAKAVVPAAGKREREEERNDEKDGEQTHSGSPREWANENML